MDTNATVITLPSQSEIADLFKRIEKVVPVEVDDKLSALAEMDNQVQWTWGDLTNSVYDNVIAKKLKNKKGDDITYFDVCYWVSVKYLRGTRSMNTVKAWALTSRRFTPAVRAHFHYDELPFSHFTYAAQRKFDIASPDTGKKLWEDILVFSWEQSRNLGRDASSVKDLQAAFEGKPRQSPHYQVGANDAFLQAQLDTVPSAIFDVPQMMDGLPPQDTIDLEAQEFVRVGMQLLQRFTAKHPKYNDALMQAFSVISNILTRP